MLDDLRKKSPQTKESYAFWGSILITAIVGGVWLISLPTRIGGVEPLLPENSTQTAGAFSQFFGRLKENASSIFDKKNSEFSSGSSTEKISGEKALIKEETEPSVPPNSKQSTILIATSSAKTIEVSTSSSH